MKKVKVAYKILQTINQILHHDEVLMGKNSLNKQYQRVIFTLLAKIFEIQYPMPGLRLTTCLLAKWLVSSQF